jgi:hypothetical protein
MIDKFLSAVPGTSFVGEMYCEGGRYNEGVVRNNVDRIQAFNKYIMICYKNGEQAKI